ncbi:hypothetical protein FA13DRAFT_1166865 [Coprinellus micaceus]|uniref:Uncharacterized protein n=1 Tax=Coprinellus micaceus TaxID=71717 RepID=A0A4Y7SU44_COPMI|nr:hypothetical protein FA13DRAFT_1166865 [Coprinellus micaceus]
MLAHIPSDATPVQTGGNERDTSPDIANPPTILVSHPGAYPGSESPTVRATSAAKYMGRRSLRFISLLKRGLQRYDRQAKRLNRAERKNKRPSVPEADDEATARGQTPPKREGKNIDGRKATIICLERYVRNVKEYSVYEMKTSCPGANHAELKGRFILEGNHNIHRKRGVTRGPRENKERGIYPRINHASAICKVTYMYMERRVGGEGMP